MAAICGPALVMVPNWMGVTEASIETARRVAGDDYVVLVADVYGKKVRPKNSTQAGKVAGALRADLPLLRARGEGGGGVEGAGRQGAGRSGADRRAGLLLRRHHGAGTGPRRRAAGRRGQPARRPGTTSRAPAGAVKAPVLVLNGAADKGVGNDDIVAFGKEMDAGGADWQFVNFSGAVHCFAEESAGNDPASNCRYDARSARRAFTMLESFFDERFED